MANNRERRPVAVIGLGRFGSSVALELDRRGIEVLAIDSRPEVVQRMAGRLSQVVVADSTEEEALRQVGLTEFRRVVVAISDQEVSILTTALLSDLGVPHIWAKALSRQHARILERVGAHHVVRPESEMGERVAHLVSGRLLDWLEIEADWVLARARTPQALIGVPLGQSGLRTKFGVTVVSVRPGGTESFCAIDAETTLGADCQILVMGRPEDVERFVELP